MTRKLKIQGTPTFGTRTDMGGEWEKRIQANILQQQTQKPMGFKGLTPQQLGNIQETKRFPSKGGSATKKKEEEEEPPKKDEFYYDVETGRPTGIEKGGSTYFGLNISEAEKILADQQRIEAIRQGIIPPAGTQASQMREQERLSGIASNIGQQQGSMGQEGQMGQEGFLGQGSPISWRQVGLSALTSIVPSATTGALGVWGAAAIGAKAGAKVGSLAGIKGVAIGALVGIAVGVYRAANKNMNAQTSNQISSRQIELKDAKTNAMQFVTLMNIDPDNAEIYVEALNQQLSKIDKAHSILKIDTQRDLNLALSNDGTQQLQRFQNFYSPGGGRDMLMMRAREALSAPDMDLGMRGLMMSHDIMGEDTD